MTRPKQLISNKRTYHLANACMYIYLKAVKEEKPGEKWQKLFEKYWPFYYKWFTNEGLTKRAGYTTSYSKLKKYMPELQNTYEQLTQLAGGSDVASRFLSMYNPPQYLNACSQLVWDKGSLALIRNYDYDPHKFEGALLYTNWLQPVIAMSDCIWGVLDGMNYSGLSVSLAFGGRRIVGEGFGIPLILRYILETCTTTQEAIKALQRVPSHMAYNVTVLDAQGNYVTVYLSPDYEPVITNLSFVTNHQELIDWEDYAVATHTRERKYFLEECVANSEETLENIKRYFLEAPLFNTQYEKGFGTLYTSVYYPEEKSMQLIWQKNALAQSFDNFIEKRIVVNTTKLGTRGNLVK